MQAQGCAPCPRPMSLAGVSLGQMARSLFYLDPNVAFINHGSRGATPAPVLQAQGQLICRMEQNPDRFFNSEREPMIRQATASLAAFVGCSSDDLCFVVNATTGVNSVMRSMDLQEGDDVVCLNLAYFAISNTLRFICYNLQKMVKLVEVKVTLPLKDFASLTDMVMKAISPNTRLAVFDHISSPHGLLLPIEALIATCHQRGVPVLIDGAHGPGQLPLNLQALNADFYVGNCYKWLFGCKGCAFLYVKKQYQHLIRPTVTSRSPVEQDFVQDFLEQGTRNETAFMALPAALSFWQELGPERLYEYNSKLLSWAAEMLVTRWRTETLLPAWQRCPFMVCIRLPPLRVDRLRARARAAADTGAGGGTTGLGSAGAGAVEIAGGEAAGAFDLSQCTKEQLDAYCDCLRDHLMDTHKISVAVQPIQHQMWIRISAQVYNVERDYERLAETVLVLQQQLAA